MFTIPPRVCTAMLAGSEIVAPSSVASHIEIFVRSCRSGMEAVNDTVIEPFAGMTMSSDVFKLTASMLSYSNFARTGKGNAFSATTSSGEESEVRVYTLPGGRSEEHTSELQSRGHLVCRLLL